MEDKIQKEGEKIENLKENKENMSHLFKDKMI